MDSGMMQGKVVLVTGAGNPRGLGAAIARKALAVGATVIISDLPGVTGSGFDGPGAERLHRIDQDVTRVEDWEAAMSLAESLGGLHGLVNNAAFYRPQVLDETSVEAFEISMRVNELGPFLGMQHAARLMRAQREGSIVNISSTAGLKGSSRAFAYCASKWALRGMTKAAAMDLAPHGVRVNSVHPGQTRTDMILAYTEEQRRERTARIPLGRSADPSEIAETVIFLLSPASGFITGAEVAVDGGFTL